MKRFSLIFFILILSLTLTGCSLQELLGKKKSTTKSSSNEQKQVIAVALDEEDPNRALILRGIQDMAKKEDLEVKVLTAEDIESSQANQKSQSKKSEGSKGNSGGSKGQNGQSSDSKESESPLKDAKILIYQGGNKEFLQNAQQDKIPVLALNELPAGVKAAGVILPDPDQAGELMAEPVMRKVTEGQIVYLQGDPGDSVAQEMVAAFKRALAKNPKITVHVITNPAGSESVAKQSLQEYLQKNPDKVQAICAQNEKLATQAAELLKSLQLEKKILLIGGQANLQSLQRMATGTQVADIDTAPYIQGVNAFQWAQKIMKNESLDISESFTGDQGEVPAKVVPVKPVTTENLAVIQKSYSKTAEAQKQEEAAKEKTQQSGKEGQGNSSKNNEKSGGDQEKNPEGNSSTTQGGQQLGSVTIPHGAQKVTERVRTEITREYLDSQGKVIGTEKSANDQVRTVTPDVLLQEAQKSQQGKQQAGEKKEGEEKKDEGRKNEDKKD